MTVSYCYCFYNLFLIGLSCQIVNGIPLSICTLRPVFIGKKNTFTYFTNSCFKKGIFPDDLKLCDILQHLFSPDILFSSYSCGFRKNCNAKCQLLKMVRNCKKQLDKWKVLTKEIPQSYILGPLPFNIFLNIFLFILKYLKYGILPMTTVSINQEITWY